MPRALAIELTDADAKAVLLSWSKKKGLLLEQAFRVSFADLAKGEESVPQRTARLKQALKDHKIVERDAAILLPKQSTTVRKVCLPSKETSELASMAQFEAEKFIPFNVERHIISFTPLRDRELEGTEVLIAAADEPVVRAWLAVTEGAGIEPMVADVSSLALSHAFLRESGTDELAGCIALIEIGMIHTDITLLHDGNLVTTRSVLQGLQNLIRELSQACGLDRDLTLDEIYGLNVLDPQGFKIPGMAKRVEELNPLTVGAAAHEPGHGGADPRQQRALECVQVWVQKLITNLQRTYEFSLREFSIPTPKKVLVCGEGTLLRGIEHALILHLGVGAAIYNPVAKIERAPGLSLDEKLLPAYASAYGAALRLAQGDRHGQVNLLPSSVIARQEQAERRFQYTITATMAIVAAVMFYLLYSSSAENKALVAERLQDNIVRMNKKLADVSEKTDRMKII
ncbi:pilus assembly protein PilM, partial [Candidatus Poribacteria bacterium]|nr:pilus assembly protein PilM [Candidatus Poribacteria bacterium]